MILATSSRYAWGIGGMRTAGRSFSIGAWPCVVAFAGVTLLTVLTGCRAVREVLLSETSPDGARTAYVVRVNPGGATAGFEYEVVVRPSLADFDPYSGQEWIWRSYRMPPTDIAWEDTQAVKVQVIEDPHYQAMIQTREVGGIRATTEPVASDARPPSSGEPVGGPAQTLLE